MTRQSVHKMRRSLDWKGRKQSDGTWLASCETLDLTVQLASASSEEQIKEIVEVTQMVLESLSEKGILFDYFKKHGIALTEIQSSGKAALPVVLPLPIHFSQEPALSSVGT